MKDAAVISKSLSCSLGKKYSGDQIEEEMSKVITNLGVQLNYKGKIMGHIKSIAESGNNYIQMSMTSLQGITSKADSGWHDESFDRIRLTTNIIVLGFTKAQLGDILRDSYKGTIFEQFVNW